MKLEYIKNKIKILIGSSLLKFCYSTNTRIIDGRNNYQNVLKNNIASNYSLMVGPEGDFAETEMNNLKNKGNYFMVSLGDTVLKSETASITAAGILKDYLLND